MGGTLAVDRKGGGTMGGYYGDPQMTPLDNRTTQNPTGMR